MLGFALGIAPAAAWIAVTGSLDPRILWLTAAVTFWTAGFDVIYSCQDYDFDSATGLFSIPAALGIARRPHVSPASCTWLMLVCLGASASGNSHLGALAWPASPPSQRSLLYEHCLVKPNDLSRVNAAFFTMNGWVSVLFFVFWAADISAS